MAMKLGKKMLHKNLCWKHVLSSPFIRHRIYMYFTEKDDARESGNLNKLIQIVEDSRSVNSFLRKAQENKLHCLTANN
jgi:hypothetical protein